ncbi:hypothetical protein [Castellaniella sp.]|uniref:hypothetical protein n=1 Tax=Castellaniella sp. TaxID=1955812 RepID=UPI003C713C78
MLNLFHELNFTFALAPVVLMAGAAVWAWCDRVSVQRRWRRFNVLALAALVFSLAGLGAHLALPPGRT